MLPHSKEDSSIDYENGLKVFIPIAVEKAMPFAKVVDASFLKKAQAKYKS
jgi:hypothetical protein